MVSRPTAFHGLTLSREFLTSSGHWERRDLPHCHIILYLKPHIEVIQHQYQEGGISIPDAVLKLGMAWMSYHLYHRSVLSWKQQLWIHCMCALFVAVMA